MKMSTGGIGAVATSQSCNARSMFPYAWAWNAIGASYDPASFWESGHFSEGSFDGEKTVIRLSNWGSFAPHADGIKIISTSSSYTAAMFHDETTDVTDKSGKLDASVIDFNSARYLHGVFDFSGWPGSSAFTGTTNYAADADDSIGMLQLYVFDGSLPSFRPIYVDCISGYEIGGGKTILVWDLGAPYAHNLYSMPEWKDLYESQPFVFGATWGPTSTFATDDYIVWCGMVLSDRILTDIPLPIRTHMG